MFLRSLELNNIRSIRDLKLDFLDSSGALRKWTLFIDQNGTGKSTILRSIGLITCGSEALFELISEPGSWLRNGAKSGHISAIFQTAEGEQRPVKLEFKQGQTITDLMFANQENLSRLDRALQYSNRSYFAIGYGASRRFIPAIGSKLTQPQIFNKPRARSLATLFHSGAVLHPLDAWIIDADYTGGEAALNDVRKTLSGILPNVKFSRVDKITKKVLFKTADGEVPLDQLSDGYQNAAGWVGDLIYNVSSIFQSFEKPLSARGLLLIDELDLHLHPVWQRTLRSFLASKLPNFQIVATTHSPLTVQQSGEGEVFALIRKTPKSLSLEPFPGTPNRLLIHQLLLNPLFEMNTSDSLEVERKREDLTRLKRKSSHSKADKNKIKKLRSELDEVPDFLAHTPADRGQSALLKRIAAALETAKK